MTTSFDAQIRQIELMLVFALQDINYLFKNQNKQTEGFTERPLFYSPHQMIPLSFHLTERPSFFIIKSVTEKKPHYLSLSLKKKQPNFWGPVCTPHHFP